MANAYSTAGIIVKYCVEATAGTMPTSGFTTIPGVKSIPEFGTDVNTLQTTPLSALKNHTYIPGLTDAGGSIGLTVNDYSAFRSAWDTCVSAYAGLTGGKQMWFEFTAPDGSGMQSFFFPGQPVAYGFGGADVDEVFENTANIIPEGDFTFASAST